MVDFSKAFLIWAIILVLGGRSAFVGRAAENGPSSASGLTISEFLASNDEGLRDADGDYPDWIEIHNALPAAVSLQGWYLTDDMDALKQWEFPAVSIDPGDYLVIFASGKDERDPGGELHANFSLAAGGESVALVEPDGATVAHAYADYPRQFANISYGLGSGGFAGQTETILVPEGAGTRVLIPTDGSLGSRWRQAAFDDSQWLGGTTGVGYDYPGLVGLDVGAMRGVNQSVYIRIPFHVADAEAVDRLVLRLKYEDGFVAYLNGNEVARANAPEVPEESDLPWNAGATATREDSDAVNFEEFDLTADKGWLIQGDNLLAFQGLNTSLNSSDLLVLPELTAIDIEHVDLAGVAQGYLLLPTPGAANEAALAQVGPAIREVTENPPPPRPGQDIVITARVEQTLAPVLAATVTWVVNFDFDSRTSLWMADDGAGNDAVAGDGVYTATLPGASFGPGDMVRWYVDAIDGNAQMSRDPLFPYPNDSPEYYGTVVQDPTIDTELPVFSWFVQNVGASESRSGTRGSLYCLGQFYDNVKVAIRGGSTANLPTRHVKFWANHGYKFQYREDAPRVDEFRLNNTYSDKAYLRQALAFESYDWCGCPGSESFPVRAERNGAFYAVQIFIEEPEEELLEREGLDPDGALYKMYNTFTPGGSAEKKTRRWEGRQDLDDFCRSINNASGGTLHNNIFDQVDLPRTLGYLVATILCHQNDHPHKNHFLYRDSDGSGQWCFLPWDHDLTWGSNWTGSSLHDYIYAADDQVPGKPTSVKPSHPFVGKQDCQEWNYHWNHLIDALLNDATVREMYLRRLRTVMDDFLQPPGTPYEQLFIENRIDEMVAMMTADVTRDYGIYADPWTWGGQGGYPRNQSFAYAIDVLKDDYLAVRRTHLYVTHNVDRVAYYNISGSYSAAIPNAQPADATVEFRSVQSNPVSGNQDEEYIELVNTNAYAVDVSGWHLSGGVEHTFLPGTVIVAGGSLYVTPNVRAFLDRTSSPKGGEGRFVQGNYRGHLSSWGETLTLTDRYGRTVATLTYAGNPSEQQRYLRISELMYHPAEGGAFDADEYEFIEIKNIHSAPVTLDGAKLTDGVAYTFEESRNATLAPDACIVIARNRVAFTARYGSGIDLAGGQYSGGLSNSGETIKLDDRTNSTILEFKYNDDWYDETDGPGFSLTVTNSADPNLSTWDTADAWRPSSEPGGSPGAD